MDGILQTLIGGLLALSGVLIGPYFQRRHERWVASRNDHIVLREKAQEMFDELDRVVTEARRASLSAMQRLQNGDAEAYAVPDLGRIRAIAAIYFPSALELIRDFEGKHLAMTKVVIDQAKQAVDAGSAGIATLKALPMLLTTQYQQFADDFVEKMREHLVVNVPKLRLEAGG